MRLRSTRVLTKGGGIGFGDMRLPIACIAFLLAALPASADPFLWTLSFGPGSNNGFSFPAGSLSWTTPDLNLLPLWSTSEPIVPGGQQLNGTLIPRLYVTETPTILDIGPMINEPNPLPIGFLYTFSTDFSFPSGTLSPGTYTDLSAFRVRVTPDVPGVTGCSISPNGDMSCNVNIYSTATLTIQDLTPEPATLLLLPCGLVALACLRRFHRIRGSR